MNKEGARIGINYCNILIKELEYIQNNSSGGGSWRKVILQRIEKYEKERKELEEKL